MLKVDIHKNLGSFCLDAAFDAGNETLGFLGASGCGKSLTMRCIAGIETPDEGYIEVNGVTFFDKAAGKRARVNLSPQMRKTALLFQSLHALSQFYGGAECGGRHRQRRARST